MITKGIILGKSTTNENKYLVNLPALTNSQGSIDNLSKDEIAEASVSSISGIKNQLLVGDIVFVGFEDHDYRKPIILGILQTTEPVVNSLTPDNVHDPDMSLRSLVVQDDGGASSAVLPKNTQIGEVSQGSLQALQGLSPDNLERRLQYLKGLIDSGQSGVDELQELTDVRISNLQDGQVLKYDTTTHKWVNAEETPGTGNDFIWQNEDLIIAVQTPGGYVISADLVAELIDNTEHTTVSKPMSINSSTIIHNGGARYTISPITLSIGTPSTISYTLTHHEDEVVQESVEDTLDYVGDNTYSYVSGTYSYRYITPRRFAIPGW